LRKAARRCSGFHISASFESGAVYRITTDSINSTTSGIGSKNAVWSYEHPHEAMAQIKDHLAFYPDRVDAIAEK
jgi:uncharacterized protein (DUF427 family)